LLREAGVLRVNVFILYSKFLIGVDLVAFADITLCSVKIFQLLWNLVNGEVNFVVLPAHVFDGFEDFFTILAFKSVIILALDMNHELVAVSLATSGDGLDRVHADSSLHRLFLDVVQVHVG